MSEQSLPQELIREKALNRLDLWLCYIYEVSSEDLYLVYQFKAPERTESCCQGKDRVAASQTNGKSK